MRIDFHTHVFPPKLAVGAIDKLAKESGYIPETNGTIEGLLAKMDIWGVDTAVTANIAVTPHSEKKVNDFAIATNDLQRIVAFGSVHPASEQAICELHRLKEAGIKGIKLHPEYQQFDIDDPIAYPIYETCQSLGLVTLFHAGFDVAYPDSRRAYPDRAANIIRDFPDLKIVLAHFGANHGAGEVRETLVGKNVYFDISLLYEQGLTPVEAETMIRTHGADKILMATDCPWGSIPKVEAFLAETDLTQDELFQIRYGNAKRLLGI